MNKSSSPKAKLKLFGMCFNWKALVVLVIIGAALFFVFSPAQQALAFAPFLLFALCPISMFFAMRRMSKDQSHHDSCTSCGHEHNKESP